MIAGCLVGVFVSFVAVQDTKPPALIAFEEARKAIVSGEIEYTIVSAMNPGSMQGYRERYARNGDRIVEELGDQDGWTRFMADPATHKPTPQSKIPRRYMKNADGFWDFQTTTTRARLNKEVSVEKSTWKADARDVRNAGMYPNAQELIFGTEILQGNDDSRTHIRKWSQTERDGKFVVTGEIEGGTRLVWIIDPARGWNAERITVYGDIDGETLTLNDCNVALAECDGIWFPQSVAYTFEADTILSIHVHSRKFNKPDDPQQFNGRDLGLEPGMSVVPQDFVGPDRRGFRWSDEGLVPAKRWDELERSGAKPGPTVLAMYRGELSPLMTDAERAAVLASRRERKRQMTLHQHETIWLPYVRWFIDHHKLDDAQSQKAMTILDQCQRDARQYLDRKKDELEKAFSQSVQAATESAAPSASQVATQPAARKLAELLEPIDEIFETRLKPRLDGLLTRAQKEKADAAKATQAASQPATRAEP